MDTLWWCIFLVLVDIYFLPCVVAAERRSDDGGYIIVINLFFGWTIIGRLGALAVALSE